MAIIDNTITSEMLEGKGNIGKPDTPNLTTQQMQELLDQLPREVIIPVYNGLITYLDEEIQIDDAVVSEDVDAIKLDADGKLMVSLDGGETWGYAGSSGHQIMDGSGTPYTQRSKMQFSNNVTITDNPEGNATFISIPSGIKGDKGDAATITIGEVVAGDTAEVENVGSPTDAIFNMTLPKGDAGSAATIQVGTVTSGDSASVSNRGTTSAAIFDFVLPKGDQGDPGTGLTLLGTYPSIEALQAAHPTGVRGNAYFVGNEESGVVYLWNPDTSAWVNIGAIKGAKGDSGNAGTITIGTVTESETMTVENVGTSTAAILNFGLKKGEKGDTGSTGTISVGTVSSGDTASVTNVGTPTSAIFNFVIPRGEQGIQGNPTVVNGKSGNNVTLYGSDILLNGYEKAFEYTSIEETDTINQAIGKLEARNSGGSVINVTIAESMIGNTITAVNGTESYSKVATSTLVEFNVSGVGEWTLSDGDSTTTVNITFYGVYNTSLGSGFVLAEWLEAGGVTGTFADLNAVLADEKAVRQLMDKHASIDYLVQTCESELDENIETIINNNICAKWINICDYALDTLYANTYIASAMDTADKYFYGEWVERDGVWQPKGNVPVMTSNSAPYGTASASSEYSSYYQAWKAFNGTSLDANDRWATGSESNSRLGYRFTNPCIVKKIAVKSATATSVRFVIQGSNDGTNWTDLSELLTITTKTYQDSADMFDVQNTNSYLYYRLAFNNTNLGISIMTLQFYGRELSVSVPKMTSNTAPWGEAIGSSEYLSSTTGIRSSYHYAFDKGITTWASATKVNEYVGYHFEKPVRMRGVYIEPNYSGTMRVKNYRVEASNNNTDWDTLHTDVMPSTNGTKVFITLQDVTQDYEYFRIFVVDNYSPNTYDPIAIDELQFYALDYSERTSRRYIYDHGVEVEEVETFISDSGAVAEKRSNEIFLKSYNGVGAGQLFASDKIDITDFSLVRAVVGNEMVGSDGNVAITSQKSTSYTADAYNNFSSDRLPFNMYLDISSLNSEYYLVITTSRVNNNTVSITEWWLE